MVFKSLENNTYIFIYSLENGIIRVGSELQVSINDFALEISKIFNYISNMYGIKRVLFKTPLGGITISVDKENVERITEIYQYAIEYRDMLL